MAKIDDLIHEAMNSLQEEMYLDDMDKAIQNILKTRRSVFDDMKHWVINTQNGVIIKYGFPLQSRYMIYVSLKIIEKTTEKLLKDVKVKLIEIRRY